MPQLDRVIIFGQIFWLFFIFLITYVVYTHFILSNLLKILLVRWWKLKKDITQITLKLRLTNFLIDWNIQMLRRIYAVTKNILMVLAKKLTKNNFNKPKLVLNDLNFLVIKISLETALYSNKNITKSGKYSYWT
uniref:ATP synthase F0 subunit 8 n=1 Tax=Pyropia dentata TaxID=76160 RepID=A0A8J9WUE6_PYRDN|nr:ATP synthase F0 subunit 8 [Neoporphyra dentata]WKD83565.1 ATP synthase F0 subunit 8 [Neoporphyra dentata]BDB33255.1 ATP synthase F0 subunit 8 [Neoporphyra dentata]